ncbi:MAG: sugar kinase [Phycisphaeraceae bacterium]|nr:sugar kinase [Phycisphaeraceae bacterium]
MSLLVTGSIGIDTVKTPHGVSENCLGGSSVYFSMAASFFAPVRFVGVVGDDCPFDLPQIFTDRSVDLTGLEVREGSKTFRWAGTYMANMDDRNTDNVELNVLAEAPPQVPQVFKDSQFVFLANTAPALQSELLSQIDNPTFVAADTMDLWIDNNLDDLKALIKKIDCLIINEDEAKQLAGELNLIKAADAILGMGAKVALIKKGASGSLMRNKAGDTFMLPAFPAADVIDPTGAGDSFAGGFMGTLAHAGNTDFATLKKAVACGTVTASFTLADFSLKGLTDTTRVAIDARLEQLRDMTQF